MFWSEVPSKREIQCKTVMHFSLDFGRLFANSYLDFSDQNVGPS